MKIEVMRFLVIFSFLIAFWTIFLPAVTMAQDVIDCPDLQDREAYDTHDADGFKMLVNGSDGWMFRTRLDLKYRFQITDKTVGVFERLNNAFAYHGTDLVMNIIPTRGITNHEKLSTDLLENFDVDVAEKNYHAMLDIFENTGIKVARLENIQSLDNFFMPVDNHWTVDGAKVSAAAVADVIRDLPSFASIPRKKYETYFIPDENSEAVPNQYEEMARRICGFAEKETPIVQYLVTREVGGEVTEEALFGEEEKADIVLLGTSNSTSPDPSFANFEGALKEAIGADVQNEAISGGSMRGAINNYIINGRYADDKPKIAIWEVSAYYGYNSQDFLREIVPALYGECRAEDAVKTAEVVLDEEGEETVIFDDLLDDNIADHTAYVFLEFENPNQRNIKVRFHHDNNRRDTVDLRRSQRNFPQVNGCYFAEVDGDVGTPLLKISVEASKNAGKVKAKICRVPDEVVQRLGAQNETIEQTPESDLDQKEASFFQKFFQQEKIKFSKPEIEEKQLNLPDLTQYTLENILAKLPEKKAGVIQIAKMEKATPLRKFSFDKRLIEMRAIQDRVEPRAVHILSGHHYFEDLPDLINDSSIFKETDDFYLLRIPIAVYPEASLIIKDLDKPIYLSQDKGSFLVSAGDLFILNSTLTAWNEEEKKPATLNEDYTNFRPFLTTWDGSELYIANSTLNNFGYGASKSYGITVSTNSVVQEDFLEEFGDLSIPTGWIIHSEFNDFYFGFYSYEAEDVVLLNNKYKDNLIYGIDPHDRSKNLIIAHNHVEGTKEKHGIIISRDVDESFIIHNITKNNKGSGIMLDRNSRHNIVAYNRAEMNGGDGITIYESPNNQLAHNILEHNRSGIRVRNSQNIEAWGGRVVLSQDQAFNVYEDGLETTNRNFELDPVTPVSSAIFHSIDVESNGGLLKTKGFESLLLSDIDWNKSTLTSRKYYGDVKEYQKKLQKYESRHDGFHIFTNTD